MRHIVYLLKTQNPEIGLYIKRLDFQTFRDPWLKMKKIIMMNLWLGWQASRLTSLLLNFILPPPTTAWDKNDNINNDNNYNNPPANHCQGDIYHLSIIRCG